MEKFIVAGDVAIRIGDTLKGEQTVVLLHGYLESLNIWDDFTGLIQPYVRVVALDLPGHGISEVVGPVHTMEFLADTVHEALTELGIGNCTIVGHSMGGYVTLAFAAKYPEMLDGLVLFSSTPNPDSEAKKKDREREVAFIEAGKKELLASNSPGKGFAADNRRKFAHQIEDLAELVMLTEDEGIVALLRGMEERADMNRMLSELPVPQLFILGRKDEYITPEVAENMIAVQPQAAVVWLEHSGHMGFIEQPREAAEALLRFMNINKENI
jgi:pimeloyl-ACP methyl ester carboxylesterase